jgi:hypothetical protein
MRTKTIIFKVGRDARTGKFISIRAARRRRKTTVVETMRIRVKRSR